MKFTLSLRQIVVALVFIILFVATFTLVVFWLGQQNALLVGNPVEDLSTSPSTALASEAVGIRSTLPQAMTATPKTKSEEQIILTEAQVEQLVFNEVQESGSATIFTVSGVTIKPDSVVLIGSLDYLGYQGPLEIVGIPYQEGGRLSYQLTSAKLNGQDLPQIIYPTIEAEIDALFKQTFTGYDVLTIELEAGRMIITVAPW